MYTALPARLLVDDTHAYHRDSEGTLFQPQEFVYIGGGNKPLVTVDLGGQLKSVLKCSLSLKCPSGLVMLWDLSLKKIKQKTKLFVAVCCAIHV